MSYPYRVVVTKGVEETLSASDRSERSIELPPILDRESSLEILVQSLEDRGFEKDDSGKLRRENEDGTVQEVDLDSCKVVTTIEDETKIEKSMTLEGRGDAWQPPTDAERAALREKVEKRIDAQLEIQEEDRAKGRSELETKLADVLEAGEEGRRIELEEVLLEVYAQSLKQKAKTLGNVTEVREERSQETGEYELVIRIED